MNNGLSLRQAVLNELLWDSEIDATHVAITANEGTVRLTGHVNAYPDLYKIRCAVRKVHGVRAIADELYLRLPSAHPQTHN